MRVSTGIVANVVAIFRASRKHGCGMSSSHSTMPDVKLSSWGPTQPTLKSVSDSGCWIAT